MSSVKSLATEERRRVTLHQDIWWLVMRVLEGRLDLDGLVLVARLGRGMAGLALPLLYGIYVARPPRLEASVCLWRSIIVSSLGKTLYPYCCWIKTLRLDILDRFLEHLSRDAQLEAHFFSAPLESLQIQARRETPNLDAVVDDVADSQLEKPQKEARGEGKVNLAAIVNEIADIVTGGLRAVAAREGRLVGITSLYTHYVPNANLRVWVSNLSSLTLLWVWGGAMLTSEVARAIREHCPAFKALECFNYRGDHVDEELAGFIGNLEPNTLESFRVKDMQYIGRETLKALSGHSRTLKVLGLCPGQPTFRALSELGGCFALESLTLQAESNGLYYPWHIEDKQVFHEVGQWLQKCVSLKELDFWLVRGSPTILAEALLMPNICLTSLILEVDKLDELDLSFFKSLALQSKLRQLELTISDEDADLDADDARCTALIDAICKCLDLRKLNTNQAFTLQQVEKICVSTSSLEDFTLWGDLNDNLDHRFFVPLSRLSQLKSLTIYGPSPITAEEILSFLDDLKKNPDGSHEGLQVCLEGLDWGSRFSAEEDRKLSETIRQLFGGQIDYLRDDSNELLDSE